MAYRRRLLVATFAVRVGASVTMLVGTAMGAATYAPTAAICRCAANKTPNGARGVYRGVVEPESRRST